ncbi:MAG: L-fucose:H+ symporter permease [Bacteroidales bacterium]|nr:L-fucose:H+ symporter permease [Bacteroidales bacterium]
MEKKPLVPRKLVFPFIIVTTLFALWGFANDITNPLVAAFGTILEMSASKAALIQFAFYGGYATMAFPAAFFIRKHSYKKGILLGLALYALGAFLFFPAAKYGIYTFFLIALYILTFGLAFLETTANPFILSMGDKENATRRLNLAQSFNPIGSLCGMLVASTVILSSLQSDKVADYANLDAATKASIRANDLIAIRNPYVILGCVVLAILIVIACIKIDEKKAEGKQIPLKQTFKSLFRNKKYATGVVAQVFYVGAQIMVWTFIIHYAEHLGYTKTQGQYFNMIAMGLFIVGRFTSTMLMKKTNPRKLLVIFACGAMIASAGTIFIQGNLGLYCLIAISAFMSLMFPTIYGIALDGLSDDEVTIGAAGLVEAIVGGALLPPLQGAIIDLGTVCGLPAVNFSYILPFCCFLIVCIYGCLTLKWQKQ